MHGLLLNLISHTSYVKVRVILLIDAFYFFAKTSIFIRYFFFVEIRERFRIPL